MYVCLIPYHNSIVLNWSVKIYKLILIDKEDYFILFKI